MPNAPNTRLGSLGLGVTFDLLDLLDLPPQHFALGDGDLLLAGLARLARRQQLTRALAGHDDELEPVLFRCSFHL